MPIPEKPSSYLQNLPAIFSEDDFLARFLLAFEQVLTGLAKKEGEPAEGLEEIISAIDKLFDPARTREDFLTWLAGWVALGLRADWTEAQKRNFLSRIVPLYQRRGTRENLAELLSIYTGLTPVITDAEDVDFQIGAHSSIGVDTHIGGGIPHFFHVRVTLPQADPAVLKRQYQIARALIDMQKPAHTDYKLEIVFDTLQIGVRSTIGVDTLLGSAPTNP
jgi:phage tail-like protein